MVPIIDFRTVDCETKMYNAYTTCGFAVFTNVYDTWLVEFQDWKQLMEEFFFLPEDTKRKYKYSGVEENIGYNWIEEQRLTPTMPGDLKESYNWVSPERMQEQYWPLEIPDFKPMAQKIERISRMLSYEFLYKFENIFKLKRGSLVEKHIDGCSTMRILHYPPWDGEVKKGQIRGGRHTDFGSITLLWRFDDTGGLEIENRETGEWVEAPVVENSIVLNVGDMFQRWSNEILRSTNHRVVNTNLTKSRFSMPYFVDPGRDVVIDNFSNRSSLYEPISANEYLKWRLSQSIDDDFQVNEQMGKEGKKYLPKV